MHINTRKLAFVILFVSVGLWAADDPMLGTWKLNLAKSKWSPGPPPKSGTLKRVAAGNAVKVTNDGVDGQGKAMHWEYTANYDGKDYPVTGDPARDTVSMTRFAVIFKDDYAVFKIGANTDESIVIETISKKAGKVTATTRGVFSKDGKTYTVTQTGKDDQGRPVNNLIVLEKQ